MLAEDAVLERWVRLGRAGGPLTAAERQAVMDRIRCQYQADGLAEPSLIVWAGSPTELNRRWAEHQRELTRLGRRLRTAPLPVLAELMLRAGWLIGHVLAALLVAVGPPLLLLALMLRRASGTPREVVVVLALLIFSCAAWPLSSAVMIIVRHALDRQGPTGSDRWTRSPDRPPVIEAGPGPQADPVPGWIGSESLLVICEPPRSVRTEPVGAAGLRRLHRDDGPAVQWDGRPADYYLHGVAIPERLFLEPTVDLIHRQPNSEIRRLVIERMGWPQYIEEAGLRLV